MGFFLFENGTIIFSFPYFLGSEGSLRCQTMAGYSFSTSCNKAGHDMPECWSVVCTVQERCDRLTLLIMFTTPDLLVKSPSSR